MMMKNQDRDRKPCNYMNDCREIRVRLVPKIKTVVKRDRPNFLKLSVEYRIGRETE